MVVIPFRRIAKGALLKDDTQYRAQLIAIEEGTNLKTNYPNNTPYFWKFIIIKSNKLENNNDEGESAIGEKVSALIGVSNNGEIDSRSRLYKFLKGIFGIEKLETMENSSIDLGQFIKKAFIITIEHKKSGDKIINGIASIKLERPISG